MSNLLLAVGHRGAWILCAMMLVSPLWCASCSKQEPQNIAASRPAGGQTAPRQAGSQVSPGPAASPAASAGSQVSKAGTVEVTAKLAEIRFWQDKDKDFPPNDLYDYAYIMKYDVLQTHRGKVPGKAIFVGHYNPRKPRSAAADERAKDIGGNVKSFQVGDVHHMALDLPIDEFYMGAILNKYKEEAKDPNTLYWAVWTDKASR